MQSEIRPNRTSWTGTWLAPGGNSAPLGVGESADGIGARSKRTRLPGCEGCIWGLLHRWRAAAGSFGVGGPNLRMVSHSARPGATGVVANTPRVTLHGRYLFQPKNPSSVCIAEC